MGREIVEMVIQLFYVLPVVALLISQAEEPFLQDGVFPIPEGDGETEILEKIGDTPEAVLPPLIGAAVRMVIRKIVPGVAIGAIVFADSTPLAFT
jgi:hypothetical protein